MSRAITRVQRFLRRRKPQHVNVDSIFDTLPVETLLQIITYLPCSAAVCFALSCHFAQALVGKEPFKEVQNRQAELSLLRSLLAHDYGGWDYCPRCRTLHPIYGSEGPGVPSRQKVEEKKWLARRFPSEAPCYEDNQVFFQEDYFLTWRDVHLVMLRHHYGSAHGIPLQNLTVRSAKLFEPWTHIKSNQSFEASIRAGALRLKREIRFTVPVVSQRIESSNPRLPPPPHPHMRSLLYLRVLYTHPLDNPHAVSFALCQHMHSRVDKLRQPLEDAPEPAPGLQLQQLHERIRCVLQHPSDQKHSACEACGRASRRCPVCDVEYQISRKDLNTIIVRATYDFGPGKTPDDPKWQRHRQHVMSKHIGGNEMRESELYTLQGRARMEHRALPIVSEGSA